MRANRYAKNTIKVEGNLPAADKQVLETYAQGIKEADDSLKMLMDWANERDRETIIVLFGDHLPPLNTVYPNSGFMNDVNRLAQRLARADEGAARNAARGLVELDRPGQGYRLDQPGLPVLPDPQAGRLRASLLYRLSGQYL